MTVLQDSDYQSALIPQILKGHAWEVAKGHLRGLAAMQGACSPNNKRDCDKFEACDKAVEEFIKDFEGKALHE